MPIRSQDRVPTDRAPAEGAGASAREQYVHALRGCRRRRILRVGVALCALGLAVVGRSVITGKPAGTALVVAGILLMGAALMLRPDRDPERWRRGADGEERTAELLDRFGSRRWHVLHDRSIAGFSVNLDHLVIGPTGVWVVDTKAYRAPLRARWRRVDAGGRPIDTAAVAWEAALVGERLGVVATPIVAVHGTGLARRGRRRGGVRIVPATALVSRIRRGRRVLRRRQASDLAARANLSSLLGPGRVAADSAVSG